MDTVSLDKFDTGWTENNGRLSCLGFEKGYQKNAIREGIVGKLKNPFEKEYKRIKGCTKLLRVSYLDDSI